VEGAHLLVVVAHDHHRGRADVDGDEVAGLGHLGRGGHEEPVLREDRRHVQVEDVLARVERRFQAVAGCAAVDEDREIAASGLLELDGHGASPNVAGGAEAIH
jgi:hypothetical protein